MISFWERKIDRYTDYIENLKQQKMAEKRNEEIREIISAISEL